MATPGLTWAKSGGEALLRSARKGSWIGLAGFRGRVWRGRDGTLDRAETGACALRRDPRYVPCSAEKGTGNTRGAERSPGKQGNVGKMTCLAGGRAGTWLRA